MQFIQVSIASLITLLITLAGIHIAEADERRVELEINGVVAYGDLVEPEGGGREKGVLVITHGTQAHKDLEVVEVLQKALAERGISSLAHTLTMGVTRRVGLYDCATPQRHRHEDAFLEIGAWIAWLKANGAGPVSLLGYSRGGNQVAWFAGEHADSGIDRLVLLAPMTRKNEAASYRKRYKADLGPILSKAKALISDGAGATLMDLPGFLYCPKSKASAASVISYYGPEPRRDTPALLPRIKVPVLVIAGSADTVVPDVVERVQPLADGKKIQLRVIEDAGHMFLDFHIEDAADLVAEFLSAAR
jgi:pimeloyl-ACP methyl ester carboxylesterase